MKTNEIEREIFTVEYNNPTYQDELAKSVIELTVYANGESKVELSANALIYAFYSASNKCLIPQLPPEKLRELGELFNKAAEYVEKVKTADIHREK